MSAVNNDYISRYSLVCSHPEQRIITRQCACGVLFYACRDCLEQEMHCFFCTSAEGRAAVIPLGNTSTLLLLGSSHTTPNIKGGG